MPASRWSTWIRNGVVRRLLRSVATAWVRFNRSAAFCVSGTHSQPRPVRSMKSTVSGVIVSAAQIKSPSFSRSSASATITNCPCRRAVRACSIGLDVIFDLPRRKRDRFGCSARNGVRSRSLILGDGQTVGNRLAPRGTKRPSGVPFTSGGVRNNTGHD